jgi:hypothetical protein
VQVVYKTLPVVGFRIRFQGFVLKDLSGFSYFAFFAIIRLSSLRIPFPTFFSQFPDPTIPQFLSFVNILVAQRRSEVYPPSVWRA